jgi:hypothetical protein
VLQRKKKLTCDAMREFLAILRLARAMRQNTLKELFRVEKAIFATNPSDNPSNNP